MDSIKINQKRKFISSFMTAATASAAIFTIIILLIILFYIAVSGVSSLNLEFLVDTPKPVGEGGGIGNSILGSAIMTVLASIIGLPIGIGAGVYLAELGDNWYGKTIRFVSDIMIGVPSIIVGIFIYTLVVLPMGRQSGFAGAVSLAMIMIPIVARTTEEMLKLIPKPMREAALALGVPQWRVTWDIILPAASPGIATGAMLAIARITGETAPLLFTALNNRFYNYYLDQPMVSLTAHTIMQPTYEIEHQMAWAATLILVTLI